MPSWKFTGKRVKGSVEAATIFGTSLSSSNAKATYNGKITRHHLIDIQQLQSFWNQIVDENDEETMIALATWAQAKQHLPAARPFQMQTTACPHRLLKAVAWNPLNLIVGPLTDYRLGDPANSFDDIHFRSFPSFEKTGETDHAENLARQAFNTHVRRLRSIYQLMRHYVAGEAATPMVKSLCELLRSDTPNAYPALKDFVNSGRSLLHPALWRDYTTVKNRWFFKRGDEKKYGNAVSASFVPYVSESYFPDLQRQPVAQNKSLLEQVKSPPGGSPLVEIPLSERRLLDRTTCPTLLESKLAPIKRFATGGGVRVFICGPSESGLFRDVVSNVAGGLAEIRQTKPAYNFTYVPMAHPSYNDYAVRIYAR